MRICSRNRVFTALFLRVCGVLFFVRWSLLCIICLVTQLLWAVSIKILSGMIVTRKILRDMLGESSLTFLLDHSDIFSSWFETDGPMDFVIYALSSIQVPLNLLMILILVLYPKNSNPNYNSFIFITNLAVTDIIGLILIISSVFIQQNVWSHQNNYAKTWSATKRHQLPWYLAQYMGDIASWGCYNAGG